MLIVWLHMLQEKKKLFSVCHDVKLKGAADAVYRFSEASAIIC